ncbi:hypothetical protein ACO2Q3_26585 [Caulobacter sp. KR2-114]|uniref:hypothetical protein n=1 Tax=Caulobacter sp. KR2-114 TaxID=3400912 RepID=UPI003BFE59ED
MESRAYILHTIAANERLLRRFRRALADEAAKPTVDLSLCRRIRRAIRSGLAVQEARRAQLAKS